MPLVKVKNAKGATLDNIQVAWEKAEAMGTDEVMQEKK